MAQITFSYPKASMGRFDLAAVTKSAGSSIGADAVQVTIDMGNAEGFGNGAPDGYSAGKLAVKHALEAILRSLMQDTWPPTP